MKSIRRCHLIALVGALFAFAPLAASAADADKPKPLCKMSDADVHLTSEGWSGPNCITADAFGKPVGSAKPADAAASKGADKPKPLCKMGDRDVKPMLRGGWEGPNCTAVDNFGKAMPPQ